LELQVDGPQEQGGRGRRLTLFAMDYVEVPGGRALGEEDEEDGIDASF